MTPRTTQTARPKMHHLPPPPSKMADWRIENAKLAMAALTPQQRLDFPDLPFSDKLYVLTNHKWPTGEVKAPISNTVQQSAGSTKRGKSKKEDITLAQIVKAAKACGHGQFTANALYHALEPKRGNKAIRRALAMYAAEGKLIARKCGNVTRYSLAVKP